MGYHRSVIEITLSEVEFSVTPIERSDGLSGKVLTFRDPSSKLAISIPATDQECEAFIEELRDPASSDPTITLPDVMSPKGDPNGRSQNDLR